VSIHPSLSACVREFAVAGCLRILSFQHMGQRDGKWYGTQIWYEYTCYEITKDTLNWSDTTCSILLPTSKGCTRYIYQELDTIPRYSIRPPPTDYGRLQRQAIR
jgi:hypothetical protein